MENCTTPVYAFLYKLLYHLSLVTCVRLGYDFPFCLRFTSEDASKWVTPLNVCQLSSDYATCNKKTYLRKSTILHRTDC